MELSDFFALHPRCALAFSGGVDSSYLLSKAKECGAGIQPYYVKTVFQPRFELEDAQRLATQLSVNLKILQIDILGYAVISENPKDRCYYCKREIFSAIAGQAATDGYDTLLDGTNASDNYENRPGMRALGELSVLSPLRECGLTKAEIRDRSRKAGLFTWNKPAYSCLATRISTGETITDKKLQRTEQAENYLFSLGFRDFRIRSSGDTAKVQLPDAQFDQFYHQRIEISHHLKKLYSTVTLDLEARDE